jgi:hypothetical protein
MMPQSQVEGAIFRMMMLEGTSRRIYLLLLTSLVPEKRIQLTG